MGLHRGVTHAAQSLDDVLRLGALQRVDIVDHPQDGPAPARDSNDLVLLDGDLKKMRRAFADSRHDRTFSVFGAVDHDRLADAKAFTHCRFEITERARGRDDCRADDIFLFGSLQHSRDRGL